MIFVSVVLRLEKINSSLGISSTIQRNFKREKTRLQNSPRTRRSNLVLWWGGWRSILVNATLLGSMSRYVMKEIKWGNWRLSSSTLRAPLFVLGHACFCGIRAKIWSSCQFSRHASYASKEDEQKVERYFESTLFPFGRGSGIHSRGRSSFSSEEKLTHDWFLYFGNKSVHFDCEVQDWDLTDILCSFFRLMSPRVLGLDKRNIIRMFISRLTSIWSEIKASCKRHLYLYLFIYLNHDDFSWFAFFSIHIYVSVKILSE